MIWVELDDGHICVPGIMIFRENPITIGAYSMLSTPESSMKTKLVMWIKGSTYTHKLLSNGVMGENISFNIGGNLKSILYCGYFSGEKINKLSKLNYTHYLGYIVLNDSDYVFLCKFNEIKRILKYDLLITDINVIIKNYEGQKWIKINGQ